MSLICLSQSINKSTEVGKINVNVNFSGSRCTYSNDFLISSNIAFDCVLGWDFLVNNHVDPTRGNSRENTSLVLSNRATLWISRQITVLSMMGIHICCFSLGIRHVGMIKGSFKTCFYDSKVSVFIKEIT